jgi:two-component system cell cycle response regulator DivK
MRVLVAEDDRTMSQMICELLMSAGHQPIPVFDGASAMMSAMRSPAPEMIVLDLQMPAGDGLATLRKLKASTKTALIPVLVVSGSQDLQAREAVRAAGAVTFIEKPIKPDHFLDVVKAFGPKTG